MGLFSREKDAVAAAIKKGKYEKAWQLLCSEFPKQEQRTEKIIARLKDKVDAPQLARVLIEGASVSSVAQQLYTLKKPEYFPYLEALGKEGYAYSYIWLTRWFARLADDEISGFDKDAYEQMLYWAREASRAHMGESDDSLIDLLMTMDADEYLLEEKGIDLFDFLDEEP